jgi:hypothetical protein
MHIDFLENLGFVPLIWIFYACFAIHELEEWNIARFEKKHFTGLPPTHTDRNARAWIGIVCVIGLFISLMASFFRSPVVSAYVFLPAVFFMAANSLQHVYWSIRFRTIATGLASAVLLLIPASAFIIYSALSRGLVSVWYVAFLSAFGILALAGTVKVGNEMPSFVPVVYGLGEKAIGFFRKLAPIGRHKED